MKQTVTSSTSYTYLKKLLEEGWIVKYITPIGNELEYILEKE